MQRACVALMALAPFPQVADAWDVPFDARSGARPHLRVEVHWGGIEIATHGEDFARVEVSGDPGTSGERAPEIEIAAEAGRIVISQPEPPRGGFRSVFVEVLVPEACHLELVMLRGGEIDVRDVEGEISVTNLNGSVVLDEVAGAALVNASNGAVRASFRRVDEDLDLQFSTLNGSVELCMPGDFEGQVALFTDGDPIVSDFTLEPHPRGMGPPGLPVARGRHAVRGKVGTRARWLVASTLNGEIRLERCR